MSQLVDENAEAEVMVTRILLSGSGTCSHSAGGDDLLTGRCFCLMDRFTGKLSVRHLLISGYYICVTVYYIFITNQNHPGIFLLPGESILQKQVDVLY